MTKKHYCQRDCIYYESNYHMDGDTEWETVQCRLGHNDRITGMLEECDDYNDGMGVTNE